MVFFYKIFLDFKNTVLGSEIAPEKKEGIISSNNLFFFGILVYQKMLRV